MHKSSPKSMNSTRFLPLHFRCKPPGQLAETPRITSGGDRSLAPEILRSGHLHDHHGLEERLCQSDQRAALKRI